VKSLRASDLLMNLSLALIDLLAKFVKRLRTALLENIFYILGFNLANVSSAFLIAGVSCIKFPLQLLGDQWSEHDASCL